jgi:hypothetical protein
MVSEEWTESLLSYRGVAVEGGAIVILFNV